MKTGNPNVAIGDIDRLVVKNLAVKCGSILAFTQDANK